MKTKNIWYFNSNNHKSYKYCSINNQFPYCSQRAENRGELPHTSDFQSIHNSAANKKMSDMNPWT